jgi:DNA-binding MarR family transcriptional regulator
MILFDSHNKSDLVVFNYLAEVADLDHPVRIGDIARATGYHYSTTNLSVIRLEKAGHIERTGPRGRPFFYAVN